MAQTSRQTHGHGDSMTNLAQRDRVGDKNIIRNKVFFKPLYMKLLLKIFVYIVGILASNLYVKDKLICTQISGDEYINKLYKVTPLYQTLPC